MISAATKACTFYVVALLKSVKPGFQLNATHATQPIALRAMRALRKRKPQTTPDLEGPVGYLS